jgi:lipoprotein-anchoring transpeptidase ErfK/SrfK
VARMTFPGIWSPRWLAPLAAAVLLAACSDSGFDASATFDTVKDTLYAQVVDNGITIVVDTPGRYLYLIEAGGKSMRYGIGVGREGFGWAGEATIKAKQAWPTWTPPPEMLKRDPEARPYANGMPGGLDNPLGARAMYLYIGDRDTLYRLHGTNEAWSIGHAVSSGCVRLLNQDVIDLYNRVPIGTKVVVIGDPSLMQAPAPAVADTIFPGPDPFSTAPTPPKKVGAG